MAKPLDHTIDDIQDQETANNIVVSASEWYSLQQQLGILKARESELRKQVFEATIRPFAQEGTNKFGLADGYVLTATLPYNYKVDPAIGAAAADLTTKAGINMELLIDWEPKLKISEYRKLTEKQRKEVDMYLTISEGTPQMKIAKPKR